MFIHQAFLGLDVVQAMLPGLSISHVFGEGNVMADAISRQFINVMRDLSAQIGVTLEKVEVPQAALDFLVGVVDRFESSLGVLAASS